MKYIQNTLGCGLTLSPITSYASKFCSGMDGGANSADVLPCFRCTISSDGVNWEKIPREI